MVGDTKAQKAAETLRRYCAERGCNADCIFYSRISATCKLKVKSPDCFPAQQKKILASSK
jgi:hypothetical protein